MKIEIKRKNRIKIEIKMKIKNDTEKKYCDQMQQYEDK